MHIRQETAFYALADSNTDHLIAVAKVDSGTLLVVRDDGTALGTDGQTWAHVSREVDEDEYEELGWTTDAHCPQTLQSREPCTTL